MSLRGGSSTTATASASGKESAIDSIWRVSVYLCLAALAVALVALVLAKTQLKLLF